MCCRLSWHAADLRDRDAGRAPRRPADRDLPERIRVAGVRRMVRPVLEMLAGVRRRLRLLRAAVRYALLQSVVPGLAGFNALSPGIVMGIMILPLVSSLSEDALRSVPNGLREGAYALGSHGCRPPACRGAGGVLRISAAVLAMSRAIGETMIVAIAAGQQPRFTLDPRVPVETMTAYIVQVSLGDTPPARSSTGRSSPSACCCS